MSVPTRCVPGTRRCLARWRRHSDTGCSAPSSPRQSTRKNAAVERSPERPVPTGDGPRNRALVLTAAFTGSRFGELAGLQRRDVDCDERVVTVRRSVVEVNGRLEVGLPKTAAVCARSRFRRPLPSRSSSTSLHTSPLMRQRRCSPGRGAASFVEPTSLPCGHEPGTRSDAMTCTCMTADTLLRRWPLQPGRARRISWLASGTHLPRRRCAISTPRGA
jgi:hypothetical protein